MEWISVKDQLPDEDITAYVCNEKYGLSTWVAIYHQRYNVWKWYAPSLYETILLDVTHYIELPLPPIQ